MNPELHTSVEDQAANDIIDAVASKTVGIFDSGIGGFTVAREIISRRPDLNLLYFGDSLNVPYGGRSPQQLARFAANSINFLKSKGMDILAVGCNASNSILGQGELHSFGIRVFDLVSSTIDWLKEDDRCPDKLALVATVASVNSGYWQRKLTEAFPRTEILVVPAPDFVPLIEGDGIPDQVIRESVARTLKPCLEQEFSHILHGCTHFPLLQTYMAEVSTDFMFIDPAVCLAENLTTHLPPVEPDSATGSRRFYSSMPSEIFYRTAESALGIPIESLTSMYIVNPCED